MIYIFRCRNCKETQEFDLGINDEKPVLCKCGGDLQRVYTPPNVHYVGSGFYHNDSKLTPVDPLDYDGEVHTPADLRP